jgi:hypothetical protein
LKYLAGILEQGGLQPAATGSYAKVEKKVKAMALTEHSTEVEGPLKLTGTQGYVGFLEASFQYGEGQGLFQHGDGRLGLVLDWSMPFPVVSEIQPGTPASQRPQLSSGLVLISIDHEGIRLREPREEVEKRLLKRPIHLVFEAPAPERFDFFGTMKMWKRMLHKKRSTPTKPALQPLAQTSAGKQYSLERVRSSPGFFNNAEEPRRDRLPPVIRGGATNILANTATAGIGKTRPQAGVSWTGLTKATKPAQQASSKSLAWMASAGLQPDPAYQHLVDEPRKTGPDAPEHWPLHHDHLYKCGIADMMLAWRTQEAYEVGFRGKKYERITQMHLTCAKGAPVRKKRVVRIEEVYCDMCGKDIAVDTDPDREKPPRLMALPLPIVKHIDQMKAEAEAKKDKQIPEDPVELVGDLSLDTLGAFYYCRTCLRQGNRFELCPACHAIDVIQAEGKHRGKDLHPHFLRCQHRELVCKRFVNDVCPGMPHIRRVMCDYCGVLAGSFDSDSEVWVCTRCPDTNGLRFEICVDCYNSMKTVSDGVDRIRCMMTLM